MLKGLKRFYYSKVIKDDETGVICDTPKRIMGVNKLSVKPSINKDSFNAEDKVYESVYSYGDTDVEITVADLTNEELADLLGHTLNGAEIIRSAKDAENAPYVCIGYERTRTNGKSILKWLYKGRFQPGDEDNESSGKDVKLKPTTLKATFEGFNYNGDFDRTLNMNDPNYTADQGAAFFENPIATYDAEAPTASSNIADGAIGVNVGAEIVITFNKAVQAATVTQDNIFVMALDGSAVEGALSIDSTGKIVTFKPTTSLNAVTPYMAVVTTAVKSLTGVKMANRFIVNFTTA